MRRIAAPLSRVLACAALLAHALPAVADPAPVCNQSHYIKPSDLYGIAGAYELSNGDFLRVNKESRHFFAEMGKTGRMEIIPLNENEFVEKGGTVRFRFERDFPDADVTIAGLDTPRSGIDPCRRPQH